MEQLQTITTSDGARLSVRVVGVGPCLVLLHGWAMSNHYWDAQITRFARDHKVIAPDFRSHGNSARVSHGHRMARYAKDVLEVVRSLHGSAPFWLAGWSMGASVALSLIDLFPDVDLHGLIYVDQTPRNLNAPDWPHGVYGLTLDTLGQEVSAVRNNYAEFLERFLPGMFAAPPEGAELKRYMDISFHLGGENAAEILCDHCTQDWRDVVARLTLPTLVIGGADFGVVGGMTAMTQINSNMELCLLENQKHCLFLEAADEFEHEVRQFMRRVGTRRQGATERKDQ